MWYIPLSRGLSALVDDEDYERVSWHRWFANDCSGKFYASRNHVVGGKRTIIRMHRFIVGAPVGLEVDHVDHDTLNNCRANLRVCAHVDNAHNSSCRVESTSRFKGVSWCNTRQKWRAQIRFFNRTIALRLHDIEEQAARAYDVKAHELFGEFASLNFPMEVVTVGQNKI